MPERFQATLRVEPHMIPALRAAFADALAQLRPSLQALRRDGFLPEPWLGDEMSDWITRHYSDNAMQGPTSGTHALRLYETELQKIVDNLQRMEADYRRTEGDNAARWGRRV